MQRSFIFCLRRQLKVGLIKCDENESLKLLRPLPCCVPIDKAFHKSCRLRKDDKGQGNLINNKKKSEKIKGDKNIDPEEEKLRKAAIEAAKSLPGDWNQIADDLMARLQTRPTSLPENEDKQSKKKQSSLLSTMEVKKEVKDERPNIRNQSEMRLYPELEFNMDKRRGRTGRFNQRFQPTSLYGAKRLGIFDAEKVKADGAKDKAYDDSPSLWQIVSKERMEKAETPLPRNGFEEMVQWTKEGRMWTFPVNNEEGLDEEKKYKFHEHIFFGKYLKAFPSEGPIRKFMDLVVLGLGQNPWITVPEKLDHIRWYVDYFKEKQGILEASIGKKAIMKQ